MADNLGCECMKCISVFSNYWQLLWGLIKIKNLHIFIDFKNQNCNFISGFTKSVSLRHQFMETQAFHELMQDSTMYETHSTTSSDAGSPFPSGQLAI